MAGLQRRLSAVGVLLGGDDGLTYDVAFSFASAQREYVEATARELQRLDVRVFYDADQQVDLWGVDLYQRLVDVYMNQARYCVVFISQAYRDKLWTAHELKAIQARAFQESREYLLPARFDDVQIPGLLPTVAYLDLTDLAPRELALKIAAKVAGTREASPGAEMAIDRNVETRLAEAVFDAEDYLLPQPLGRSDAVAERIRSAFRSLNIDPSRTHLVAYLVDGRAAFRVVGYTAWQIYQPEDAVIDLVACVNAEQLEAIDTHETRPLWQLLVCFTFYLRDNPAGPLAEMIRERLRRLERFLLDEPSIDTGGQCLWRVQELIGTWTP